MLDSELSSLDPASIRTVSDLGRQLTLLRLTAPRPTPEHSPPTLRELAALTSLPRSTLGNAESGRILPRVNVVYRFVRACGVSERAAARWTDARNRVAHADRRRRRERHDHTAEVVQRLAEHSDHPPLQAALDILRTQSVTTTVADLGRTLDKLAPARLTAILQQMPTHAAVECLHVMAPQQAAATFEQLGPLKVAELLQAENAAMAAEHLQLLEDFTAQRALLLLPVDVVSRQLEWMPRHAAETLAAKMPPEWVAAFVADRTVSVGLAADLIFLLPRDRSLRLLRDMPTSHCAGLLSSMDADPAAGLLKGLSGPQTKAVLAAMTDDRAVRIVAHLMTDDVVALVRDLPAANAAALLAATASSDAADVLVRLHPDRRPAILAAMSPAQRHAVGARIVRALTQVGAARYNSWDD
jgi:Mg/Co/Ni transporter MgtE